MTEKIYPTKSYLDPAKRAALLRESGMDTVCAAESQTAREAGDIETAWDWLACARLPTGSLKSLKRWYGADFIRARGFDTSNADADLGPGWLDAPSG